MCQKLLLIVGDVNLSNLMTTQSHDTLLVQNLLITNAMLNLRNTSKTGFASPPFFISFFPSSLDSQNFLKVLRVLCKIRSSFRINATSTALTANDVWYQNLTPVHSKHSQLRISGKKPYPKDSLAQTMKNHRRLSAELDYTSGNLKKKWINNAPK